MLTLGESGLAELRSLGSYLFYELAGPAGLPPAVVQKLNEGLNTIARMPEPVLMALLTSLVACASPTCDPQCSI